MHGIGGYQQGLQYQDGLYGGLLVKAATGLNVRIGEGLAIVGNRIVEQTATGAATDLLLPASSTVYIYVNHPDALDSTGAATLTFDYKKEGDKTKVNINGSTGTAFGRSILLAKVVTGGAAVTTVDNTERLKVANIPGAMWSQNLNA